MVVEHSAATMKPFTSPTSMTSVCTCRKLQETLWSLCLVKILIGDTLTANTIQRYIDLTISPTKRLQTIIICFLSEIYLRFTKKLCQQCQTILYCYIEVIYLQHGLIYAVCEDHSKVESKEAKEASNYVIAFDPVSRQRHIMVCFQVQFNTKANNFSQMYFCLCENYSG